ncbi:hypothetical protein ACFQU2_42020 [Siccirubricoccus deserti]
MDNLVGRGELEAAERRFAELLAFANDVGLLAEEVDPARAPRSATSRRPSPMSA